VKLSLHCIYSAIFLIDCDSSLRKRGKNNKHACSVRKPGHIVIRGKET
jgi:hypothetical protein